MPVAIEHHVNWIADCIAYTRDHGWTRVEATEEAQEEWVAHVAEVGQTALYGRTNSWYVGANIPGKPRVLLPYTGGQPQYRERCNAVSDAGYEGMEFSGARDGRRPVGSWRCPEVTDVPRAWLTGRGVWPRWGTRRGSSERVTKLLCGRGACALTRRRTRTVWDAAVPVALFVIVFALRGTTAFHLVVGEDGVLEWAQVAGFAVAAWASFSAGLHAFGRTRLAYYASGTVLVGVIGEEMAWGTRLIGSGLGFVEAHNEQGDTTLHNLGGVLELSFLGITAVATVLGMLILLRWAPFRDVPLTLVWSLMVPAAYTACRVVAGDVPHHVAKLSEAAELVHVRGRTPRTRCSGRALARSGPGLNGRWGRDRGRR